MTEPTRPCPSCKTGTTLHALAVTQGRDDPLAITVRGLQVIRCERGHTHFVAIDFPRMLVKHLLETDEAQLPAAERKGLIFKHFHCAECNKELEPKPDHRHVFTVDLTLEGVAPFSVDLSMPVYRCTGCGKEQLHSLDEIRAHTPGALAKAFEAADIAREG